jgi:hypothetical protein
MPPVQLLYALGLKQIRQRSKQVSACCPFHDDRVPSFSMDVETGLWFCHAGCGGGNTTMLLARLAGIDTRQAHARLMECRPWTPVRQHAPYVRKTARCGGSMSEIERQLRRAQDLVRQKIPRPQAARALMDRFSISRSTAYRRLQAAEGRMLLLVNDGVRLGVRTLHVLKRIRERVSASLSGKASLSLLQDENLTQPTSNRRPGEKPEDRGCRKAPCRRRERRVYIAHGQVRSKHHALFNPLFQGS